MLPLGTDGTVVSLLRHWSMTSPDTPAYVFTSGGDYREVLTRQQVYSLSRRCASWLYDRGVRKGDVVTIILPAASMEQLLMVYGAAVLGAVPFPTNPILFQDGSDVIIMMERADATAVVIDFGDQGNMPVLQKHITDVTSEELNALPGDTRSVRCEVVPTVKTLINCRTKSFTTGPSFLTDLWQEKELDPCPCHPDDVVIVLSTSGTTGITKLVPRTHRQMLKIGEQLCEAAVITEGDTVYNQASYAWVSGFPSDFLLTGATRVVLSGTSSEDDPTSTLWKLLCREQPQKGMITPYLILSLLSRHSELMQRGLGTWKARVLFTGSLPVGKQVCRALGILADEFRIVYGSTETGFNAYKSYTEATETIQDYNCGKTFLDQEMKLLDDDQKEITQPGTRGQLLIRNDAIFTGYLKQPEQSKAVLLAGGWYLTGDCAWRDDKGDYFVGGRQSDSFMVLALIVYPEMLERQLQNHPAITEIGVVGIPDPDTMNRPCVCIVSSSNTDTQPLTEEAVLQTYADSFNQEVLKGNVTLQATIPKWCLFFDKFPHSWTGKLQRRALRAQAMERLSVSQ